MRTLLNFGTKDKAKSERVRTANHIELSPDDGFFECEHEFWVEQVILNPKTRIRDRKLGFRVNMDTIVDGERFPDAFAPVKAREEAEGIMAYWKWFHDTLAEKKKVFDGRYFWDFEIENGKIRLFNKNWVMD